jgi:hypothetical protein
MYGLSAGSLPRIAYPGRMRTLSTFVLILLVGAGAYIIYRSLRVEALSSAYRQRLHVLSEDYARLSARYDAVVKRTSVTELVVEGGQLSVVISTVEGELKRIPTPFDPKNEIHVDYVVRDGRLWIRRIHDSATSADHALLIDPALAGLSWESTGMDYGITIYRPLSEGRWIISVTANGALSLVKEAPGATPPATLEPAPRVQRFEQLDEAARNDVADLTFMELVAAYWHALTT